ncbi:MAG: hypothetical protein IJM15_08590 [Erysipelotrichaceae bacterium]|nr:hypothetical protein [Erysipelotrichaceae bacterium]
MKIRYFSAFVFKLLMIAVLMISGLSLNSDNVAAEGNGSVRITKISYIWYNGNPDRKAQPDNTFRYGDGTTNGHTFTSKRRNANIDIHYSDEIYSSAVRIKIVELDCLTGEGNTSYIVVDRNNYVTELTKLKISSLSVEEYVRNYITEYYDSLPPWEYPLGINYEQETQKVLAKFQSKYGIRPSDNFSDATAKASGFGSWSNMIQIVKEQFYSREMGRLSVDGKTSWCIEPKVDRIGAGTYVSTSSRLPSEQWALSASLIMSDAIAKGADKNDVNGNNYYFAAQVLIWELVDGLLDYETLNWKSSNPSGYYKGVIVGNKLEMYYQTLKEMVLAQRLDNIPSFLTSSYDYQLTGQIKTYTYPSKCVDGQLVPDEYLILYDRNGKVLEYEWTDTEAIHFEALDASHLKITLSGTLEETVTCQFRSQRVDIEASDAFAAEFISTSAQDQIVLGDWLYYNMTGYLRLTMEGTRKQDAEDGFPLLGDKRDTMVYITGGGYDGKTEYPLHDLPPFEQSDVTYVISEAHAPVYQSDYIGYVKGSDTIEVVVTSETQDSWAAETWSGVLKDKRQKGRITIVKKVSPESYESEEYLKGIVFGIYAGMDIVLADGTTVHKKGDLIEKITTDENGKAVSSLLELGLYEIRELQVPFGMALQTQTFTADIKKGDENSEVIEFGLEITNEIAGYISLYKQGYQFSSIRKEEKQGYEIYVPVFEKTYLKGVEFGIYANQVFKDSDGTVIYHKDDLIETISTAANGIAESGPLSEGKYYVMETATVEGYVLDQTKYEFTIERSKDGQLISTDLGEILNRPQKARVILNKAFENDAEDLTACFGLYAGGNIPFADGSEGYNKDQLIDVLETGKDGQIAETLDLPYGSYYLKELKAPEGYMLDYGSYPFEFGYSNENGEEAVIEIDAVSNEIENCLERVSLRIIKYDSAGILNAWLLGDEGPQPLSMEDLANGVYGEVGFDQTPECMTIPDTEFTLYDSRGNPIESAISDQQGNVFFTTKLAKGEYILKETLANENYLNTEEFRFTVDDQHFNTTLNFAFANDGKPGIAFIKINRHGKLLAGCEITIFDEFGQEAASGITDEYGRLWFTGLFPGKYYWIETAAPAGYQSDGEEHPFEITEDGELIHVTVEDKTDGTCYFIYDGTFHGTTVYTGHHDSVTLFALVMLFTIMAVATTLLTERIRELQR